VPRSPFGLRRKSAADFLDEVEALADEVQKGNWRGFFILPVFLDGSTR
jgi:hypothetical protein